MLKVEALYTVNFDEKTKQFTPGEKIPYECEYHDVTECVEVKGYDGRRDDVPLAFDKAYASAQLFTEQWIKHAPKEDKKWSRSPLAVKLRVVKFKEYYFQFANSLVIIDYSKNLDDLIARYGVKTGLEWDDTKIYYWPLDDPTKGFKPFQWNGYGLYNLCESSGDLLNRHRLEIY
jgi:hypothetical protein